MELDFDVHKSELDASVNFVTSHNDGRPGFLEARYVRREQEYFIVYVSSQSGCNKACRFCHLTQTGQTQFENASISEIIEQAQKVLEYYDELDDPARIVHYNFMARGEVLANPNVIKEMPKLLQSLTHEATSRQLIPRVKFSTIMPREVQSLNFAQLFAGYTPDVYYSLYSTDPKFRKRWMPKAIPYEEALAMLKTYQDETNKIVKLHWAYIEGENDSEEETLKICEAVNDAGLRVNVNIVRYNPYSDKQGREPTIEVIERNARILGAELPGSKIRIVGRVGFDVKASCGMFVASSSNKKSSGKENTTGLDQLSIIS